LCFQDKLSRVFPEIKITVSKKADSIYPIVSAASICAKVSRDKAVNNWRFKENVEIDGNRWGSGYPAGKDYFYIFLNQLTFLLIFKQIQ